MDRVVCGPLEHPQFGKSLVIDPGVPPARPDQFVTQAFVVTTAARLLMGHSKNGDKLAAVVVTGADRDPMAHPEFRQISENLRELMNKWYPKATLVLESNGQHLDDPEYRHALSCYHRPILSFEAGTQKTFAALTGRKPAEFKDVCENLSKLELDRWVLRANFVRGGPDNSTDSELKSWLGHLEKFNPALIQVTTPKKAENKAKPVTKARITEIAEKASAKTGVEVEIIDAA
jgi:wyosine [tRNA(Phe)-imidazoG37] synthetase (radical SAM superfamily)